MIERSERLRIHLVRNTAPVSPVQDAFERHASYVARVATRLLGRRQGDVEDLVQDVFVEATRGIERLRDPQAIRGWLATITVRLVRRRLRANRLLQWFGLDRHDGAPVWDVIDRGVSPSDRALLSSVYEVLDDCAAGDRLAWALRMVEGETLEDVAALLHCSLATAKRRIARVQAKIDSRFADE